jgi:DUF2971 family protein
MPFLKHDNQIPLEPAAILWRYMSRDKFESLLRDKALFFCRADKFSDPFEGSVPKREAEYRPKEAMRRQTVFKETMTPTKILDNLAAIGHIHRMFKMATVVNCWQINQNESDAMWRLYLKDNEGVAIQTTAGKMMSVIESCPEEVECSKVRYLDYATDIWFDPVGYPHTKYNLIIPLIHKRKEFQHENEFRLYQTAREALNNEQYWNTQPLETGKLISFDVATLIEKVIFPPTSDQPSQDKIVALAEQYGFAFQYRQSRLSEDPIY